MPVAFQPPPTWAPFAQETPGQPGYSVNPVWLNWLVMLVQRMGGEFGTMAYQDSDSVAIAGGTITGGSIDDTPIGTTTPASGK